MKQLASITAMLSIWVWTLLPAPVAAVVLQDLYQVDVPVASYSRADRNTASRQALEKVFMRTTPLSAGKLPASLQKTVREAPDLLQGYRYMEQDDGLLLQLSFPAETIQQAVTEASLPFWGARRPKLLLWTVMKNGAERQIVSDLESEGLGDTLYGAAEDRALPVQLPLMDLADSQQLYFSDIWAKFDDVIAKASKRYATDGYAVLRVSPIDGASGKNRWQGDWQLHEQGRVVRGAIQAADADQAVGRLVGAIADEMSKRYALRLETSSGYERLTLNGISSMKALVNAGEALRALSAINEIEVVEVSDSGVVLNVQVAGGREGLQRALRLERRFSVVESKPEPELTLGTGIEQPIAVPEQRVVVGLNYQWAP